MLLDSESNPRPRVLGSFKYSGTIIGTVKWRSGRVQAREINGSWILEFVLETSDKTVLSVPLSAETVEKVVCKSNHLMLEAHTKQYGQFLVHFKPQSDGAETELNRIYAIVTQAQKPFSSGSSKAEVGLGLLNKSHPQAAKPLFSSYGGNSSRNITTSSASPPRFTSMKENRKLSERHNDAKDEESKENRNTMSVSPSDKFLQRGTEKSREILSSFGTSGFYSSTPSKPSVLFTYSKKRTPGLMPDPKQNRPLLSENISYSWSQQKTSQQSENKPVQTLHGFSNLGNTCYMNAILQSLYGLETFATDLLYTNHKLMKNFTPQSLYYSLAKLLNSRRTNVPDTIRRDLLRNVKTAISSTAKRFSGYQQHDAHEFLCQVLDQLKEEVIKVGKATPSPSPESSECSEALSSTNVKQDYVNPTVTNFEFEVRHSITCFQCGEEVNKTEQYNDISVDLLKTRDPQHPPNLQQALDKFFKKECIEYTCEKCGHTKSEVAHKFVRLPRVFILHLKRYSYNSQISQNMKRGQSIGIPIYLTLQPHCEELTVPPLPPQLQLVYASPLKSCSFENRTDDTARRKLDYQTSGFKFKRIRSTMDSDEESKHSPSKKFTLEHAVKDGTLNKIPKLSEKPLEIITDEDSELEKVLELSRREAEERKQLSEKSSGITDEDTELENILELSRREAEERKQMNENFNTDKGDDEDFTVGTSKPDKGKNIRNDNVYPPDDNEELLPEVINNEKGDLPYSYRLISIVNHVGTSSVIGHYISDVYDIKKQSWFSFDDSHVTRTTEQEVQSKRERTGYIFFYISKDIFDDLKEHHKLTVGTKSAEYT
ncbi:hypothetical protein CHS0354_040553 [Potamilus streckersoni]|uniref:Ubiquitin carboxyl-terminal hydrolase n=1 Tax=Potamilus streckersoni TaxID=2493646 RepID=A0AAE0VVM2_9BIVA|nr:hypothetical protein CHS0354_040553 [Potamilus streckersoni]